ncbi:hypothetical protein CBR_g45801 [Chara braunii]|uniref:Uncharacterized protein n=1 Tax=Chara braunii TaxID=69332 RepID=A0A388LZ98_CHABU|nr:hypothetical protein CBR_g45801 [Chara braunii]|eukprot:GBG87648.1 hypothetical protein CBR_g45801 [Chara braunii]
MTSALERKGGICHREVDRGGARVSCGGGAGRAAFAHSSQHRLASQQHPAAEDRGRVGVQCCEGEGGKGAGDRFAGVTRVGVQVSEQATGVPRGVPVRTEPRGHRRRSRHVDGGGLVLLCEPHGRPPHARHGYEAAIVVCGRRRRDKHEDDGLAAYQEASIQRLVGVFTSAVIIAEATDDGRVSHERLKTMADAMRMMLAATMWLMRMAGDDHRVHYDAWVFVQLTVKPTLVASMHRCFDAHRHIVQVATVITDKLASPPITLIDPPMYVPDWASIGVKFSHDATLSSLMEAKKMDWMGTGPLEDEDDGKGDEEGSGGGR